MSSINSDFFQLGVKYQTDKVTTHGYHRFYPHYLEQFRNKEGAMLEIGIYKENSMKLWLNYFQFLKIYGIDINIQGEGDRYKIYKCDQSKINELEALVQNIPEKLCFINDDGSHIPEHQVLTFNVLFEKLLEPGGVYIIEDIEVSYWNKSDTSGYPTHYGYKHPKSSVELFKHLVDDINSKYVNKVCQSYQNYLVTMFSPTVRSMIQSITFSQNCIIIQKKTQEDFQYSNGRYIYEDKII
jgi:hypothetical protein